ncbi:MAG: CoA transferase subunit A [Bacteroidales bacterium]|nr:CoA transferase subunit A [Bacteroidales bacterium]
MNKRISLQDAVAMVKDGMTVMVGGFLGAGSPVTILDELAKSGVKNLTLICNDTAYENVAHGQLITNKQVKKLYVSHIGTNKNTGAQLNSGELEIEFCPQGTLAERVRAAGAGLGGVLTTTGLGTVVAEGKETVVVDGKTYLLEKPLKADIALIGATIADEKGNLVYTGTTNNFYPLMATAADVVIVEAEKVVKVGEIAPERVHTPAMFVDYIYSK